MLRFLLVLSLVVPIVATSTAEETLRKRPLDLPAGGKGVDGEEEDSPEIITFYGAEFEGNAFIWCFGAYMW